MTAKIAFEAAYFLRISTSMLAAQLSHGRNTGNKWFTFHLVLL